ncbi:MAG: biosynthetic peptidoglycan transglycosylase, partial [Pseudomonadota bacterium]
MASRAKRQPRIEPTFGDDSSSSLLDLRLGPQDRTAAPSSKSGSKSKSRKSGSTTRKKTAPKKPAKSQGSKSRGNTANRRGGRSGAKRRSRKRKSGIRIPAVVGRIFKRSVYWSAVAGIWCVIGVVCVIGYYAAYLPPTSEWQVPVRPPNVKIVALNGDLLANRGDTGGEAVRLEQLPPYLPNAVIAIEDRRFRSHFGVDPIGLMRAAYTNFTSGRVSQGGSTLTQQLAKN